MFVHCIYEHNYYLEEMWMFFSGVWFNFMYSASPRSRDIFYGIRISQMISLWSNIAVKCSYNFAMMSLGGPRKCLYTLENCTWFWCMLNFGAGAGNFSVFSPFFSLPQRKMYRNDISTFHRKLFNILIFLSKTTYTTKFKSSRIPCFCSPSRRFETFTSLFICVWCLPSYVLYPAAQFKQIAWLFLSLKIKL